MSHCNFTYVLLSSCNTAVLLMQCHVPVPLQSNMSCSVSFPLLFHLCIALSLFLDYFTFGLLLLCSITLLLCVTLFLSCCNFTYLLQYFCSSTFSFLNALFLFHYYFTQATYNSVIVPLLFHSDIALLRFYNYFDYVGYSSIPVPFYFNSCIFMFLLHQYFMSCLTLFLLYCYLNYIFIYSCSITTSLTYCSLRASFLYHLSITINFHSITISCYVLLCFIAISLVYSASLLFSEVTIQSLQAQFCLSASSRYTFFL